MLATEDKAEETFDFVILWWLVLGLPLSWKKGSLTRGSASHRWIGIDFSLSEQGAVMRLPPRFVAELLTLIEPICKPTSTVSTSELEAIIGKAARVAHVVPAAKPFVAGLWGGLAGAINDAAVDRRAAPPGRVPCRRLCFAASWVRALLTGDGACPLRLERLVAPRVPTAPTVGGWSIEFDASIYGGGAVLRNAARGAVEYFSVVWYGDEASHLNVVIEDSKHQTFWEFATLLLALVTWGDHFVDEAVMVVGDNAAALSCALTLKGKGELLAVARELSWRQAVADGNSSWAICRQNTTSSPTLCLGM